VVAMAHNRIRLGGGGVMSEVVMDFDEVGK
jgi:hypothetical protein